jgi:hypothetical protein
MFGGDLPTSDSFTISLITNPEVLEVNQHSSGGHQSYRDGEIIAWTADAADRTSKYVAIFNTSERPRDIELRWRDVDVHAERVAVRSLWGHKDEGMQDQVKVPLAPHACVFYKVATQ